MTAWDHLKPSDLRLRYTEDATTRIDVAIREYEKRHGKRPKRIVVRESWGPGKHYILSDILLSPVFGEIAVTSMFWLRLKQEWGASEPEFAQVLQFNSIPVEILRDR